MKIPNEPNPFTKPEIAEQWKKTLDFEHAQENSMDRKKIIYPYVLNWIAKNNIKGVIVDFGSGEGFLSSQIPEDLQYVGVEPSKTLTEMAIDNYKEANKKFIVGNAYDTGLKNENADAVVSVMVWFHLQDLEAAANELFRNLKPRSKFLIITANPKARKIWESFYENLQIDGKTLTGIVNTPGVPMTESITYIHTNEETKKSLKDTGLKVENIETIGSPEKDDEKLFVAISGTKPY